MKTVSCIMQLLLATFASAVCGSTNSDWLVKLPMDDDFRYRPELVDQLIGSPLNSASMQSNVFEAYRFAVLNAWGSSVIAARFKNVVTNAGNEKGLICDFEIRETPRATQVVVYVSTIKSERA